ncbi:MAG: DUF4198 domain-containing protein [Planctomycetota bacterium]
MTCCSVVRHTSTGCVALAVFALGVARGHDTWVQTATNVVRPGDVVHVDFCLGNHGNGHRDFKLAGKLSSLDGATLVVRSPGGVEIDLRPTLVDLGSAPREGYWSGRFVTAGAGLHTVSHTLDKLHRTTRAVKSCKTYVLVSESLDELAPPTNEHAVPLGHPFELVVETHPVIGCGPGNEIRVRLLHQGRPLPDHVVTFIPRGATLATDFDPEHERRTDAEGRCSFTPRQGTPILVVAHLKNPDERGEGYDATAYTAALVINVPERRPGREED